MRWYQSEVIPGILQTEPYIRAIIEGDDVEQQTAVRRERQKVIDRPDGPELNFILSESALRRNLGDRAAMRETFTDADYLDSPEALRSYNRLWGRLQAAALGPAESRRLIRRIADEIK
nr:DUF5753 domain-containing protein [Micromonospora sp. KC207]